MTSKHAPVPRALLYFTDEETEAMETLSDFGSSEVHGCPLVQVEMWWDHNEGEV